jgi:hypothetical protein
MLCGFNFAHRTGDGFHWEQSGGARGILDDVLPEVGLWAGPEPTAAELAERKRKAAADIVQRLAAMPAPQDLPYTTPRYLFWSKPNRADVWPALEAKSFTRDFAGQLVAVKRPAYYAAIYVGKPAPGQFFIRGGEGLRLPLPDDAENRGAVTDPKRGIAPFLGGGLTLFWTPAYGSAVLAANWSPTTVSSRPSPTASVTGRTTSRLATTSTRRPARSKSPAAWKASRSPTPAPIVSVTTKWTCASP